MEGWKRRILDGEKLGSKYGVNLIVSISQSIPLAKNPDGFKLANIGFRRLFNTGMENNRHNMTQITGLLD